MNTTIELSNLYAPEGEAYLPFQLAGITELLLRRNVLLADEMGLGKTIQVLGYINLTKPNRVLVICPNNLRLNWLTECNKWLAPSLLARYDIEQCTSSAYFGSDFVIASYEGLVRYSNTLRKEHWDLIVVDEAHYVKSRSAKRSQALYALANGAASDDEMGVATKKLMLTGTPLPNYVNEVFPLIHWLDPDTWPSAAAFESRYMPYGNRYGYHLTELQEFLHRGKPLHSGVTEERVSVREHGAREYICQGCADRFGEPVAAMDHCRNHRHRVCLESAFEPHIEQISKNILSTGVLIRRLKKEVLPELPKKRRQVIELPAEGALLDLVNQENELWTKHRDVSAAMEQALADLVPETTTDEGFEGVIESLRQTKRYFFDEIALIRHALARAKAPYICEHLENLLENKDKIVVFVHHRDVAEAIYNRFLDKAVLVYGGMHSGQVYEAKDRFWKDEKIQLFIGSIKMAGVGLNLQVASTAVFAELDWVPGVITQAEDRLHRIGQEQPVLIQHLVAQDSMDSHMAKRIINKQKSINKALNRPLDS